MKFGPDIGQLQKGGADPVQVVKDFLPLVQHMHLKDFSGGEAFLGYCPLGEGKVNLPAILAMMDGKTDRRHGHGRTRQQPEPAHRGQGHGGDREGVSVEAGRFTARLSATDGEGSPMRRFYAILAVLVLVVVAPAVRVQRPPTNWSDYGGTPDNARHVALDQIDKTNLDRLGVAWSYPSRDTISYVFNPIVVDNVAYVLARNNSLVAIDATTGKEIWIHEDLRGIAPRGINYWESKDRSDRRLLFQMNSYLQAIDARTGKSIMTFGTDGAVNLREGLRRDPATLVKVQSSNPGKVFENLIILGSAAGEHYMAPPGDIRAYDVVTGRLAWQFHTVPHPGEFGYETWPKDAWKYIGGANNWGELSVDAERGIAYVPTGSPTYDYYGADRHGANLFGTVAAGARRAHRQAALALPDGAPRPLGLRQHRRAAAGDDHRRRQAAGHRRAGREDRLPLRVRPRHRRADLADRGAARSRPATSPARRPGRRSRFPPPRRPSPVSRSPSPTSIRTSSRRGSGPSGRSASAARATRGSSRRRRSATPCRFPARKAAPTGAPPRPTPPAGWSTS